MITAIAEPQPKVFDSVLLRSTTPAPNEKVLLYLEGMQKSRPMTPTTEPPSLVPDTDDVDHTQILHAPSPRGSRASNGAKQLEDLAGSQVSYGGGAVAKNGDDMDSTVQEGRLSEVGSVLPVMLNHPEPLHEPGPNDLPGPRYESFDSVPSWGNKGPLPDTNGGIPPWSTWQPNWQNQNSPAKAGGAPQPDHALRSPTVMSKQPWGGATPGTARGIPLPDSVASPSIGLNPENPMWSPHGSKARRASTSKASHRSKSVISDDRATITIPKDDIVNSRSKATSRVSKAPATESAAEERAQSPLTHLSAKSRATGQTRGTDKGTTVYPPLPDSAMSENNMDGFSASKSKSAKSPSRAYSKAYSVSPSDSPSQPPKIRKNKSPSSKEPSHKPIKSLNGMSDVGLGSEHLSPKSAVRQVPANGTARSPAVSGMSPTHQNRPFSPYRHAPTNEDLLHAAARGVAASPRQPSPLKAESSRHSRSQVSGSEVASRQAPSRDADATPTPSRPHSPVIDLDHEEEQLVKDYLDSTPYTRTSYAGSSLEPEIANSHFHDMDLCILLHQVEDPMAHEVVKKALRKAVRQRVKKLGIKNDSDSIKQYRKSFHDHDPSVHLEPSYTPALTIQEPPDWAKELMDGMLRMQERLDGLGPKIERLKSSRSQLSRTRSYADGDSHFQNGPATFHSSDVDRYAQTPLTQTVNMHTQHTGTGGESLYQNGATEVIVPSGTPGRSSRDMREEEGEYEDTDPNLAYTTVPTSRTHGPLSDIMSGDRDDSPGQQFLEEELYKLRVKSGGSQSGISHRTWEVTREAGDDAEYEEDAEGHNAITESGLPEIPDSGGYTDRRPASPPLPALPRQDVVPSPQGQVWQGAEYGVGGEQLPPPWQRIHQRLLSWAIIWPMTELDSAINSTTRGQQIDEVALSIWSTQTYKRYVRSKMTDSPPGRVDRLFVPPNMADAINNAVFHGRHGDACGMLRDLWSPFGLDGMPRLLIVLAKHRSDANHWVVHRFSLPDGALTTYDSFPERTLPDGRPLGWWFAIRVAWPSAIYPSPDHLMQKMVRLHRPMQLGIDNSVAAAGIWRNLLMGSRAERSVDLERLRDLINTEVKNLRQRKQQGKLSIGGPRPNWEDMN